jgi:septal ring factor EnvC (AmiA/AmiB activator)
MNNSEETIYRRKVTQPDLAELKSQLARLRQDCERFSGKVTASASTLHKTLQAQIKQVEAAIAATEQHKPADEAQAPASRPESGRSQHHASVGNFRPRFRPGR